MFTILLLYAIVAAAILLWGLSLVAREGTAHGQAIILSLTISVAMLWPLALAYALIVAGRAGIMWCLRRVGWAE